MQQPSSSDSIVQAAVDHLQRPIVAEGMKRQIDDALKVVPKHKRAAVLLIHDFDTRQTRAHFAARLDADGDLKVAAGGGWDWTGKKPTGWVGIGGSW